MPTIQPNFLNDLQKAQTGASLTMLEKAQIKEALITNMQRPEEAVAISFTTNDKPSPAGTAT